MDGDEWKNAPPKKPRVLTEEEWIHREHAYAVMRQTYDQILESLRSVIRTTT